MHTGNNTIYCDRRLGGIEHWIIGDPKEVAMRIPNEIRDCVGFLCLRDRDGNLSYGGTACLIAVPCEEDRENFQPLYLVTAKHCIDRDQTLILRLNTQNNDTMLIDLPTKDSWYMSENGADVAVIRFIPPPMASYRYLTQDMIITLDVLRDQDVGIGDELVITGLFTYHHGKQRNLPILRSGIIAAMPEEPLEDSETGLPYHAYLAELRSLGGLSGSPVFILIQRGGGIVGRHTANVTQLIYQFYLLGLLRGHWDVRRRRNIALDFGEETEQVHMGMAIITPSQEVLALLGREDVVKERRQAYRNRNQVYKPTFDAVSATFGLRA